MILTSREVASIVAIGGAYEAPYRLKLAPQPLPPARFPSTSCVDQSATDGSIIKTAWVVTSLGESSW